MKIRLMGSPDVVREWAALLGQPTGREYPCRGSSDVRRYVELDDSKAVELAKLYRDTTRK